MWIQSKGDATIPQLAGVVNEFLAKAKQRLCWEPKVTFEQLVHMMVDADLERHRSRL